MIYIVTYQLNGPAGSYAPFFEALKSQGAWAHYLNSTWFVATDKTVDTLYNSIRQHLQSKDFLFIGTLTDRYEGWMPKDAWDWLKAHGLNSR